MRYSLVALALLLGGCGADVHYGGMADDGAMSSPDGARATYADTPNIIQDDNYWMNGPQPAGAELPGQAPPP
jgi:hypothetical protein